MSPPPAFDSTGICADQVKEFKCTRGWSHRDHNHVIQRIQKDHVEQEVEADWAKEQEVGHKPPYLQNTAYPKHVIQGCLLKEVNDLRKSCPTHLVVL